MRLSLPRKDEQVVPSVAANTPSPEVVQLFLVTRGVEHAENLEHPPRVSRHGVRLFPENKGALLEQRPRLPDKSDELRVGINHLDDGIEIALIRSPESFQDLLFLGRVLDSLEEREKSHLHLVGIPVCERRNAGNPLVETRSQIRARRVIAEIRYLFSEMRKVFWRGLFCHVLHEDPLGLSEDGLSTLDYGCPDDAEQGLPADPLQEPPNHSKHVLLLL